MLLLVPQPLLSIAYLLGVHAEWLRPSFVVVGALAVFPIAAALLSLRQRGPSSATVVGVAVLELAWAGLGAALTGFAIAWQAG